MSSILPVLGPNHSAPPDAQASVFFIHGLGGDQRLTWTAREDAFWPSWLAEMFPGIAVFSLGYEASPSSWLGSTMPISDRALQLLALLEARQLLRSPVIFIVHSLGGLVVKEMIRIAATYQNQAWETVARQTLGIVFLATPHSGARIADYLGALSRLLRLSTSVHELEANAPPLRDLNLWYRNNARRLDIQTRVFFESQQTNGVRVVDEASADPGIEGVFPIPVDANHISICKLNTQDTLVFLSVAKFIHDLTAHRPVPPLELPSPSRGQLDTERARNDPVEIPRVHLLKSMLSSPESEDRLFALRELRKSEVIAADALEELVNTLTDSNDTIRQQALDVFGELGPRAAEGIPLLLRAVSSNRGPFRFNLILALGRIGPTAAEAIPIFLQILEAQDYNMLIYVKNVLPFSGARFTRASAPTKTFSRHLEAFSRGLTGHFSPEECAIRDIYTATVTALGQIGPEAKPAVPHLIDALCAVSGEAYPEVIKTLGQIGPAAKPAVPHLIEILCRKSSQEAYKAAIEALGQIGSSSQAAVPHLVEGLNIDDVDVSARVATALGQIGPAAIDAVPHLVEVLERVEIAISAVLAEEPGWFDSARRAIFGDHRCQDLNEIRKEVIVALGAIGPRASAALPSLQRAANEKDELICAAAATAIAQITSPTLD
jgi:HEAT repeat protein/pimeloyl-ACP methyl ester carboxylesterase